MSAADYQRVWQINETLRPKPDDLISTSRFFVREGELGVWDEKKRAKKIRYFFLFNDILLLCKKESSKRYWLRIHITLRSPSVSIEEIGNASYNHEFRLHCRSRSFMLYAPTAEAKEDWINDLRRAISGDFPQEQKDKQLQKQGQEVLRKRDDSEPVKKVAKKKRGADAEEEKSDGSEQSNGEAEQEEEAPKVEKKKENLKKRKSLTPQTRYCSTC